MRRSGADRTQRGKKLSASNVIRSAANAILFGVMAVIVGALALGYFLFGQVHETIYDTSDISAANECRGMVIGADATLTRFVFFNERVEVGRRYKELCVLDIHKGVVPFVEKLTGYKNETVAKPYLEVGSSFQRLPPQLAKPFEGSSLPRVQFNSQGLILVKEGDFTGDGIEAAVFSYDELGLASYSFANWPADAFAAVYQEVHVEFERVYLDADEYVVSLHNGSQKLGSFNVTLEKSASPREGVVIGGNVLISMDGSASAYTSRGEKLPVEFCCVENLRLLPGNPNWILSRGDRLKAWRTADLGLR